MPLRRLHSLRRRCDVNHPPQWQLIAQAVESAVAMLDGADAADVRRLAVRYVKRYREA